MAKQKANVKPISQSEMITEAWKSNGSADLFVMNGGGYDFPLYSEWECGGYLYLVTAVFMDGGIQLSRTGRIAGAI